jgi:hypothetical protein
VPVKLVFFEGFDGCRGSIELDLNLIFLVRFLAVIFSRREGL